jgi:hypothetical protein
MADAAYAKGDAAGQIDAVTHLAAAKSFDSYAWRLFSFAMKELPDDLSPAEHDVLGSTAMGLGVSMWTPPLAVTRYCKASADQALVRQQCSAIAELFSRHASTLLEYKYGNALGQVAGWSQQTLTLSRQHSDALSGMMMAPWMMEPLQQFSCAAVAAMNAYLDESAGSGETAALTQRLLQSGMSEAEAAAKYRQFIESLKAQAAQALSPD